MCTSAAVLMLCESATACTRGMFETITPEFFFIIFYTVELLLKLKVRSKYLKVAETVCYGRFARSDRTCGLRQGD